MAKPQFTPDPNKTAAQILEELKAPFPESVVHWRIGPTNKKAEERRTGDRNARATKGQPLLYIDARDVMKRLDEVVGIDGWQCRYPFAGCCELSIRINGEWITKSNAGSASDIDADKGLASDAFKRSAVCFGVFRYGYYIKQKWVELDEYGKFTPPKLPDWALPSKSE